MVARAVGLKVKLVPNDAKSLVTLIGSEEEVKEGREFLRLMDVPRQVLNLRVTVESPVDHLVWSVDARLTNGQLWKTADGESGTEIALEPRLNADGTLEPKLLTRRGGGDFTSHFRLHRGKEFTFDLGRRIIQDVRIEDKATVVSETAEPLPKVTVRFLGP